MQGSLSRAAFWASVTLACVLHASARAEPPAAAATDRSAVKDNSANKEGAAKEGDPKDPPTVKLASSAEARRRAAQFTAEAQSAYHDNDFERASVGYQRAYAAVPAPELLFNLGQCQRQLGRPARAVGYFEAYLNAKPNTPHRATVQQLIAEAKAAIPVQEPATVASSAPPAGGADPAAPSRPMLNTKILHITPLAANDYTSSTLRDDNEHPALYERWWFWTGVGVLVAAGAATAFVLLDEDPAAEPQTTLGSIRWQ